MGSIQVNQSNFIEMNEQEWIEKYKPIANPFAHNDIMFDWSPQEVEFMREQSPLCIWTDLECDGYNYISSGWHFVNRLGYYVTEVPFDPVDDIQVMLSTPEDEGDEEDDEEGRE
jgi:hypothetical protein